MALHRAAQDFVLQEGPGDAFARIENGEREFAEGAERAEVVRAFPEWQSNPGAYDLAMDFCISAMQGLLLNREIWEDRDRRIRLRQFISTAIVMLRSGAIQAPGG